MSRNRDRKPQAPRTSNELDEARNELFSHINRCGVLHAAEEQQVEWMRDTIEFLGERYPSLTPRQMEELQAIGLRFCRPAIVSPAAEPAESAAA